MSSIQGAFDELDASARDAGGEDHCGVGGSARSDAVAGTPIAQEKTTSSWLRSRVRSGVTSNASAASTTSHRPSRGPPRPTPRASICERFFFDELRTFLSQEQASQWLLSVPLTDKHRSPPPRTMRRSVTLGNLRAGDKAASHAQAVFIHASAASTITSHLLSSGPPRPAPRASICQRFFFEELRTCLGEEQAIQWLLMSQLSTTLTDEHRSPPPGTMRRSVTLGNLQAGEKAAAHAPVVVMHGKRDLPPLIGQAGGGVCRGAGDVVSVSSLARARARVKDADSVGLMFTDAAHLVLGPRTPSE